MRNKKPVPSIVYLGPDFNNSRLIFRDNRFKLPIALAPTEVRTSFEDKSATISYRCAQFYGVAIEIRIPDSEIIECLPDLKAIEGRSLAAIVPQKHIKRPRRRLQLGANRPTHQ